jgi:transcriptional regulator with GAF, ATPase, and Fis domain
MMHEPWMVSAWRAVGRGQRLGEVLAEVGRALSGHWPATGLVIRQVSGGGRHIRTVAEWPQFEVRTYPVEECTARQEWWLEGWLESGRAVQRRADGLEWPEAAFLCGAGELAGDVVVVPLAEGEERGVLLALSHEGFSAAHRKVAEALCEPLSVALASESRWRHLEEQRKVAEADRQSLLRRLGRKAMTNPVVGADGGLRQVMERVSLVAPSDAPVLLLGETGSGKEVIARAVHAQSSRSGGPFVRVNCGAIPGELIDSELFGHERGSFTGAVSQRRGWFEQANGGTLLLDEVGELPLAAQVRLLRILQDGICLRVGGEEPVQVDVRIIAATNRDLAAMVQVGRFREDLWYRMAVFPIVIPPLREHPEDIPALADTFAERAAIRFGVPHQAPTRADLAALMSYRWPGNIRELSSVIDRAVILGGGRGLEVAKALGQAGSVPGAESRVRLGAPMAPAGERILTLDAAMKQHIERALVVTRGQLEGPDGAAALLGINPNTLRGRMRKLGIRWQRFRPRGARRRTRRRSAGIPGQGRGARSD